MDDARAAWNEVGARFTGLGQRLKTHFNETESPPTGDAEAPPAGSDSTAAAVKEAMRRIGEAIDAAVGAVAASAKDPAINEDVRAAAKALGTAMAATFGEVGDDLRRVFNRTPPSDDPPSPS